jgi:hypothetical protein
MRVKLAPKALAVKLAADKPRDKRSDAQPAALARISDGGGVRGASRRTDCAVLAIAARPG